MIIRVLLADDHPVYLEGLHMLLDTVEGIEVVGTATDGVSLLALAERVQADVAVVDLDMPAMDGASAAAALKGRLDVLVLTMHEDSRSSNSSRPRQTRPISPTPTGSRSRYRPPMSSPPASLTIGTITTVDHKTAHTVRSRHCTSKEMADRCPS
jgi:CheY-like chemotaxis protein